MTMNPLPFLKSLIFPSVQSSKQPSLILPVTPKHSGSIGDWDHSETLLHAAFSVLTLFVQDELGGIKSVKGLIRGYNSNTEMTPERQTSLLVLKNLYRLYVWYHRTDWTDPVPLDEDYKNLKSLGETDTDQFHSLARRQLVREQAWHQECQKKLRLLVRMRPFLTLHGENQDS